MNNTRVVVFGDSIAYGAWDSEGGWVDRLKRELCKDYVEGGNKNQVLNFSIGGATSERILEILEPSLMTMDGEKWDLIVVLSFGSNDSRLVESKPEFSIGDYEGKIRKIVSTARKYAGRMMFVSGHRLGAEEVLFGNRLYTETARKEYEAVAKRVFDELGVEYVDVVELFAGREEELLFRDKVHINDEGHKVVLEEVRKRLMEGGRK